jgi:hypothetical protein
MSHMRLIHSNMCVGPANITVRGRKSHYIRRLEKLPELQVTHRRLLELVCIGPREHYSTDFGTTLLEYNTYRIQ